MPASINKKKVKCMYVVMFIDSQYQLRSSPYRMIWSFADLHSHMLYCLDKCLISKIVDNGVFYSITSTLSSFQLKSDSCFFFPNAGFANYFTPLKKFKYKMMFKIFFVN